MVWINFQSERAGSVQQSQCPKVQPMARNHSEPIVHRFDQWLARTEPHAKCVKTQTGSRVSDFRSQQNKKDPSALRVDFAGASLFFFAA
jgi:hypothetical protein